VLQLAVTFLEAFDSTGSIYQFLFAGKKRMACRADFGADFLES
jgi:hypothetical protein